MGDRLGIRNVVDIFFIFPMILQFKAPDILHSDSLLGLFLLGRLLDQANTCLIHFYKRYVSLQTIRLLFLQSLRKPTLLKYEYSRDFLLDQPFLCSSCSMFSVVTWNLMS